MKLVFWQNIISPHQSYFLRELSSIHEVILIVEKKISSERVNQGWSVPDLGNTKILFIKDSRDVYSFIDNYIDAKHFFSGFNSYPLIKIAFKEIIKTNKVNIIAESAIQMGWKKSIRFFIYKYYFYKYNSSIDYIFAMGDIGVNWYKSVGFPSCKIFSFQYFTEIPAKVCLERTNDKFHILFIGQLIKRKGIDNLLTAISLLKNKNFHLTIIGDGVLRKNLLNIVNLNNLQDNVTFMGNLDNKEAMLFLNTKADCLILPSRFDGWGAVVNESLSRGVPVVVSDKCGASSMIINDNFGSVYAENSIPALTKAISALIENQPYFDKIRLLKEFNEQFTISPINEFINLIEEFYKK